MQDKISDIAQRIRGLRDDLGIAPEYMANKLSVTVDEYLKYEEGETDFSFSFLYNVSKLLNVSIEDLLTGTSPKLKLFSLVKKGEGLKINRRQGFDYQNLAHHFINRSAEPMLVKAYYNEAAENKDISLSSHRGQEFDYVLKGSMRMRIDNHEFVLNEGDSVYYDSSLGHGMVAVGSQDCEFIAIVIKDENGGE